jgi:mannobiose 2-epimerase
LVWYFARLSRTRWGTPDDLEAARHGCRFVLDRLCDPTWGGLYWEVSPTGEPMVRDKEALGQSYGLYALTEYARATADPSAATAATDLWRLFDRHFHDERHGGYVELRREDWSAHDGPGPYTRDARYKTLSVQLHVLEALVPFADDAGSALPVSVDRLRELALLLGLTMGNTPTRPGHSRFGPDWRPVAGPAEPQYGHDVELLWMLEDAWRVLRLPATALLPVYAEVFDDAMRFGYDFRRGGFLPAGLPGRPAHFSTKEYWAQAEGLLAALRLYRLTEDARYGDCYLRTLDWIVNDQADWVHGDWHERVDRHGRPSGPKAGFWKEPYHHARALIECLEALERDRAAGGPREEPGRAGV